MSYLVTGKKEQLQESINEANRFLSKAKAAIVAIDKMEKSGFVSSSCKEVAAAKRASMDLTRSLVAARK
ncbi:hypothetical protein [Shewanella sp.]|uniref:hypothetical protein n=1 Tax=Shewanella sp. TaxID=50422 RepID=UPI003565334F